MAVSNQEVCQPVLRELDVLLERNNDLRLHEEGLHTLRRELERLGVYPPNLVKKLKLRAAEFDKVKDVIEKQLARDKLESRTNRLERKHTVGSQGDMKTPLPADGQQNMGEDQEQELAQFRSNAATYQELIANTEQLLVDLQVMTPNERTDLSPSQRGWMAVDMRLDVQMRWLANRERRSYEAIAAKNWSTVSVSRVVAGISRRTNADRQEQNLQGGRGGRHDRDS